MNDTSWDRGRISLSYEIIKTWLHNKHKKKTDKTVYIDIHGATVSKQKWPRGPAFVCVSFTADSACMVPNVDIFGLKTIYSRNGIDVWDFYIFPTRKQGYSAWRTGIESLTFGDIWLWPCYWFMQSEGSSKYEGQNLHSWGMFQVILPIGTHSHYASPFIAPLISG